MDEIVLKPGVDGRVILWTLGHEWMEQYWLRHAIEQHPVKYDGFFVTRDAAMTAALEIATMIQPALVEPGRVDNVPGTTRDWFALDEWLSTHSATRGERAYETRAVQVEVVATADGAAVKWKHEDRARIVHRTPRSVVVDGVTYNAPPEEAIIAESPWFLRQTRKRHWTGDSIEDVEHVEHVYVSANPVRFCGVPRG